MRLPTKPSPFSKIPMFVVFALAAIMLDSGQAGARWSDQVGSGGILGNCSRWIPSHTRIGERDLAEISAFQEQITIYEGRMKGRGLPDDLAARAATTFQAIVDAMVIGQISTEAGADFLGLQAQLIDLAYDWQAGKYHDELAFGGALVDAFATVESRVEAASTPLDQVPYEMQTPTVNAFQVWLIGLEQWAERSHFLTHSERVRIAKHAAKLERFEQLYKQSGNGITRRERELLHEKLIEVQSDVIEILT